MEPVVPRIARGVITQEFATFENNVPAVTKWKSVKVKKIQAKYFDKVLSLNFLSEIHFQMVMHSVAERIMA